MSSPAELAETLSQLSEAEYVRSTADWLTDASDLDAEPPLTGNRTIGAIVSAAAAHATSGIPATRTSSRTHSYTPPASFPLHGILVEESSLVSL